LFGQNLIIGKFPQTEKDYEKGESLREIEMQAELQAMENETLVCFLFVKT